MFGNKERDRAPEELLFLSVHQNTKPCTIWESVPARLAVLQEESYCHWLDTGKQYKLNCVRR